MVMFAAQYCIAQSDVAKSTLTATPITIDGKANEWTQPLRFYDSNSKLLFSFVNDDSDLYLCFQAVDAANQQKILHAGMKITLSVKTNEKHKLSISYPMPPAEGNSLTHERGDEQEKRNSFRVQNTMMEISGSTDKDGVVPINNNTGINAAINWDSTGKLTYEVAVPLRELFGNDYASYKDKEIAMNATVSPLKKPGGAGGGQSGFSGRGGGGGGHMGGGGGGRMGGAGGGGRMGGGQGRQREAAETDGTQTSSDRASMFEKSVVKQHFMLATGPAK